MLSVFFGAMVVALAAGVMGGRTSWMIDGFIKYQTGHIRVTSENFVKRERFVPVDELVDSPGPLMDRLRKLPDIERVEERVKFGIMLGYGDRTVPAVGMGLDLLDNKFKLSSRLLSGSIAGSGLYIGDKLAEKLGVKTGDSLLLATKTSEGGFNGIKLRIMGTYSFGNSLFDSRMFFVGLEDSKKLLKIKDASTEILVYLKKEKYTDRAVPEINKILPAGVTARSYKEQLGSLYSLMVLSDRVMYFVQALILFLASFVVINTLMMAVYERMKEIGTLKAMGMTDGEIFWNFTLEGGIIGAIGGTAGAIFGYALVLALNRTGISFSKAVEGTDFPVDSILYPEAGIAILLLTIALGIIIPALSAMIPARHAKKYTPAEALRSM